MVYPAIRMTSMRSRSGAGMSNRLFAVQMNSDRRQVERQIQVVVDEIVVLRRVEHLEHRRRRIP